MYRGTPRILKSTDGSRVIARDYTLDFIGYYSNPLTLPDWPGIYCIYACKHYVYPNRVLIRELLYIGESENIHNRVWTHKRRDDWESKLRDTEILCYNITEVDSMFDREQIKEAMIHRHKPPCNEEPIHPFPFEKTIIQISGKAERLATDFTVGGE